MPLGPPGKRGALTSCEPAPSFLGSVHGPRPAMELFYLAFIGSVCFGLDAGILLFRNHAPRSLFRKLLCVFCFALGVSKVPFGQHVWSRIGHPLDLNPAGVPLSRNHAPRSLFRNLLCVFCFAFRGFEGAVWAACLEPQWPPLGLESCWGSAVSQPRPTNPF